MKSKPKAKKIQMSFNHDQIKLKYILGIYKDMPGYPTGEDIIYYVTRRHFEKEKTGEVTFSDNLLLKKLGFEFEDNINKSLTSLLERGTIEIIRKTNESTTYKVLKEN
jgi:hypothetical protein